MILTLQSYHKIVEASLRVEKKRYFMIDQQIAQHYLHYSKCLYHPPSLVCDSNDKPISYFQETQPIIKKGWNFSQSWNPYTP